MYVLGPPFTRKKILDLPPVGDAAASYLERQADNDVLLKTE